MKNLFVILFVALFGLAACDQDAGEDMGSRLDDAASDLQNSAEDLCEDVSNAVAGNDNNC